MAPLPPDLRRDLERAVVSARDTAEAGAGNALAVLGVGREPAPAGLSDDDRALRVALRAQARSLGNGLTFDGIPTLTEEIAYAAWHRMLFARFLAENGLLVEPASGAPVSIEDVAELARSAGEPDPWVLAARYAAQMLPGIFGTDDPTARVAFSPDDRQRLEAILRGLPSVLFTADDALGWVYQFWQSKRKDEVNKAGKKVGAGDLAPVTQLFTEHYMVQFLLENSLGAWWAGRHPDSPLLREWEFLRYRDDGTPAAGTFEGWPAKAAEITVMDPCMGSGHFLVAAGDMLRRMRMEEEGLSAADAAEAVITNNLFGLELDPRCTQLGAFALAFDAWKAAGGYRELPVPNIACSGIAVKGQLDDWRRLAGNDTNLRIALGRLYELFQDAPELGSLIDPRSAAGNDLLNVDPDRLLAALDQALARETEDPAAAVFGAAAQGTAKAARLLSSGYWLVATNPPFLGRGQQGSVLQGFLRRHHAIADDNLATAFLQRCTTMSLAGGASAVVSPYNWRTLVSYRDLRAWMIDRTQPVLLANIGFGAFSTPLFDFNSALSIWTVGSSGPQASLCALDVRTSDRGPSSKAAALAESQVEVWDRPSVYSNPQARFVRPFSEQSLLSGRASALTGIQSGDYPRFGRCFWEQEVAGPWALQQSTLNGSQPYGGREHVLFWEDGKGSLARSPGAYIRGLSALGRRGIAVSQMGSLPVTLFTGQLFDNNTAVLLPNNPSDLPALYAYCSSVDYAQAVREIDPVPKVTTSTLVAIPFDLDHWTKVAAGQYPDGLPGAPFRRPDPVAVQGHRRRLRGPTPRGPRSPARVPLARPGARRPRPVRRPRRDRLPAPGHRRRPRARAPGVPARRGTWARLVHLPEGRPARCHRRQDHDA